MRLETQVMTSQALENAPFLDPARHLSASVNRTLTLRPTQVLSMNGPFLVGFGITSHDQWIGSAVTLNTVTVTAG